MKPSAEKADLEAQGSSNGKISCPACQAINLAGAKACAVCGTSLEAIADPADSALYQDLARANLMRMRGQSKEAADLCLAILRKAPNNVSAHALLGDIYYDQDDLRQAAEWYELASQLDPTAIRERQLLDRIRARTAEKDHLQTLEQLGVEQKGPPVMRYVAGGIALVLVVGALGYFMGNMAPKKGDLPKPIQNPITVGQPDGMTGAGGTSVAQDPAAVQPVGEVVPGDSAILNLLRGTANKDYYLSAIELPNLGQVVVTARASSELSALVTALLLSGDIFVQRPTTRSAVIRLVRNGVVVFSGEVTRDAYDEAQALSGKEGADLETIAVTAFPGAYDASGSSNVTTGPGSTPGSGHAEGATHSGDGDSEVTGTGGGESNPTPNLGGE